MNLCVPSCFFVESESRSYPFGKSFLYSQYFVCSTPPATCRSSVYEERIEGVEYSHEKLHDSFSRLFAVQRNATCAVNRLPLEIFQSIFEAAGESGVDFETNKTIASVCTF